MYEILVPKVYDLGYFRNKQRRDTVFNKEQDAVVFVFKVGCVGYVAVVTSPILPGGQSSYYGGSSREALIYAARDVSGFFTRGRDCESFELPWDMVTEYNQARAHICLKTPREVAYGQAEEQRDQDAREIGSYHDLLPLEHYIWWNETEEYAVEDVRLEITAPPPFHSPLHDAMQIVEDAIIR